MWPPRSRLRPPRIAAALLLLSLCCLLPLRCSAAPNVPLPLKRTHTHAPSTASAAANTSAPSAVVVVGGGGGGGRVYDLRSSDSPTGGLMFTARLDGRLATPTVSLAVQYAFGFGTAFTGSQAMTGPGFPTGGTWRAEISGPAGSLVRWRVAAFDGVAQFAAADGPSSLMSPTASAATGDSPLPTFHWFVQDSTAAQFDKPVPCSVFFDAGDGKGLMSYEKVTVHRYGSERKGEAANLWGKGKSKDWDKRDFRFSFKHQKFGWMPGFEPVKGIDLHSMFQESGPVSYMRKALASRFMAQLGVPVPATRYVRVNQNGTFYGLYLMVEQAHRSTEFLKRTGFGQQGTLMFQASHWKYSNLRKPDNSLRCPFTTPDQNYNLNEGCPVIFSEAGIPKPPKPNGYTPHDMNLVEKLAYQIWEGNISMFDKTATVLEMAVQTAMLHQDRCTKNHIYVRSPNGRWAVVPVDMKDTFATDNRGDGRNCAAQGNPCSNYISYCILSCPMFNHPFYCDASHPQDIFPQSDGRSTWNHLVDTILKNGEWNAAYRATLRRVMDDYLSKGWLQHQVDLIYGQIARDARADNAIWHAGDIDVGKAALLQQMEMRRDQLYNTYSWLWTGTGASPTSGVSPSPGRRSVAASTASAPGAAPGAAPAVSASSVAASGDGSATSDAAVDLSAAMNVSAAPGMAAVGSGSAAWVTSEDKTESSDAA